MNQFGRAMVGLRFYFNFYDACNLNPHATDDCIGEHWLLYYMLYSLPGSLRDVALVCAMVSIVCFVISNVFIDPFVQFEIPVHFKSLLFKPGKP